MMVSAISSGVPSRPIGISREEELADTSGSFRRLYTLRELLVASRKHFRVLNERGRNSVDRDALLGVRVCDPVNEAVQSGL